MNLAISEIKKQIYLIRGFQVMIDSDLASLFDTRTKILNQAVRRNTERFPEDFMFQTTEEEFKSLRSQFVTLNKNKGNHRKYLPLAFTEHGVAMLSSIVQTDRAIEINIAIMRAFTQLRQSPVIDKNIHTKLNQLEAKVDQINQKLEKSKTYTQSPINQINSLVYRKDSFSKTKRIIEAVLSFFHLKPSEIMSVSRNRRIVFPRQIAIYLLRKHSNLSFEEIGRYFGGRDHTTILHAYQKVAAAVETDQILQGYIRSIESAFFSN